MARAHTHLFSTTLNGGNENVATSSLGLGSSVVTLDLDLITLRVTANFSGLSGNVTEARLYAPTAAALLGIAIPMSPSLTNSGFPTGGTSGSYDFTFDLADAPGYDPGFITASGGTVSDALNALDAAFDQGKVSLTIRTTAFPNGEIRGFFTEIPEPTSLLLLGACVVFSGKRRRGPSFRMRTEP